MSRQTTIAAYGTWPSTVTTELVTAGTVGLSAPILDGETLYWLEARPDQGGRVAIWRQAQGGERAAVTGPEFNVRSRVHEYGGGAYAVRDGVVVFSSFSDGRVYRVSGAQTKPITPAGPYRYADLRVHPDRDLVLAVREDHSGAAEPENTLVALDLNGFGPGIVLCAGADFYSDPELSAGGELAWTEWNHPAMPWDSTRIRRGRLIPSGRPGTGSGGSDLAPAAPGSTDTDTTDTTMAPNWSVAKVADVAGGPAESAVHPRWAPDGDLLFISDRTGWWNLYRLTANDEVAAVFPDDAEYAEPQWVLGNQPYVVVDSDTLLATRIQNGRTAAVLIDRSGKSTALVDSGVSGPLTAAGNRAATIIADSTGPARLVVADLTSGTWSEIRRASELTLAPEWVSVPSEVTWPSSLDAVPGSVRGWYYPPTNPGYAAPAGELPPLIAVSHGGPTAASDASFSPALQYWTSRGFAVLDVNYRGSTGYGRPYRDALRGQWGVVDVADCAAGAAALAERRLADPARLIVRGGSAGGYTTLQALTTTKVFTAGISFYGVADVEALARDTHKFEARYLDGLIGPYPEARQLYRERSPILHVDQLSVPLLLLQGADDAVVPPNQAETMAAAVRAKQLPVALIIFEGEGHGFRRAETIRAALQAQLYFLGQVFGFDPADELPAIPIDNLPPVQ